MKKKRNSKGISLITLIITIVVVLIIASVAINSIYRQNVIEKANEAVSESNRAAGLELLRMEEVSYFLANNGKVATIEGFVDYLDSRGVISKEETEFEGENKASIILENKAVFELEMTPNGAINMTYVGQAGNLAPLLKISVTGVTTNEVTVTPVLIRRNEGGKLKYYIKLQEESEYEYKGETSNAAYTFVGLTKEKVYDIKVVAENAQGMQTEVITSAVTTQIIQPEVTFTYSPDNWTNTDVTVTAVATNEVNGMTLYIGESLNACDTLASIGITVTDNKPVYAVFKDSSNQYGGAAVGNVEKIDKVAPSITTSESSGVNSVTITGQDTLSGINAYYYSTSNTTPSLLATTSSSQEIDKWVTFTASTEEISKMLTGFVGERTYYYWFKDQAENISERGTFTTSKVPASNVQYIPETSGWTSENVQDAIDKLYEMYE